MHDALRDSGGMRSRTEDGIRALKHQHSFEPAARPQPFGPPQRGQIVSGASGTGAGTRGVYFTRDRQRLAS